MFITFEGPDNVGKTTLSSMVAEYLNSTGEETLLCSFPGRNVRKLGDLVYDLHHSEFAFEVEPLSLQLLHLAAHVDIINNVIKPNIHKGRSIVLDRYWWSLEAYAVLNEISIDMVKPLIDLEVKIWESVKPNLTFLLKRDGAGAKDSHALSHYYDEIARREAKVYKVLVVTNDGTIDECFGTVVDEISSFRRICEY